MTRVIFKKEGEHILAVFPSELGTNNYYKDCACYARRGQHSACDENYARSLPAATQNEYKPLLRELKTIGYDDLVISYRIVHNDYLRRKQKMEAIK